MATNDNAIWARPGSADANVEEPTEPTPESTDEIAVSPVEEVTASETQISATISETDNAELSHRDRQTDFFNSMSGVDEAEEELNEIYAPQGLLEVPFNDTPHNLGYRIPKIRLSMSKQTKRKVIAFSSIFSGIAAVIAAVIVLNSIFGFIPTVKQVPVFYSKGTKVYMTSSAGRFPEQVLFDGTAYQLSSNSNIIRFSPNNENTLVASDVSAKDNTYSLYLRKDMLVGEQGKMIDSGITGDYEFAFGGDAVLYLKSKGTNDLYFRNLSAESSKRIERKIEMFGMLDDSTAVIMAANGNISTVALEKDGAFTVKEIVSSADSLYLDSDTSNSFYYIKTERNTDTSSRVSCLFRFSGGKSVKVAENADRLIAYSCADNWAYYVRTKTVNHGIFDFIVDDCRESDEKLLASVEDMYFSDEQMLAMRRNNLRKNMSKSGFEREYTSIGYYSNGKAAELESNCTEIYAVDLNGEYISYSKKAVNNGYNACKSGLSEGKRAAIMYESTEITENRILFSSVPSAIVSSNSFYNYAQTLYESTVFKTQSCVIAGDRKIPVEASKFSDDTVAFSTDYSSFYYIATADSNNAVEGDADIPESIDESQTQNANDSDNRVTANAGDLMCVKLVGNDNSAQPIAVDVEKFELLSDGAVIYISTDAIVYVGSVALAVRAKGIVVNRTRTAAAILGDSGDTGARLTIYKDGATKPIADNVSQVAFNDNSSISFIKDYDKVKARGDLYVCRNFGTPTRIDSNVSSLINYPY